ncbi:hypothetical protein BB560_005395 [Smittium megazygosporum]|uniref:Uncharacterized protein n=1 Tax=Smittium megazygosporum TaxID=133381 RepID=A0A2T9Z6D7_9FUNG|nr:hypothetical protein BB560_005395 [Smittium megazygosporum]
MAFSLLKNSFFPIKRYPIQFFPSFFQKRKNTIYSIPNSNYSTFKESDARIPTLHAIQHNIEYPEISGIPAIHLISSVSKSALISHQKFFMLRAWKWPQNSKYRDKSGKPIQNYRFSIMNASNKTAKSCERRYFRKRLRLAFRIHCKDLGLRQFDYVATFNKEMVDAKWSDVYNQMYSAMLAIRSKQNTPDKKLFKKYRKK